MNSRVIILWAVVLCLPGFAHAEGEWLFTNLAIVKNHVVPRYQHLVDATLALDESSQAFCMAPDEKGLMNLQQVFNQTMDAWIGVQHLRGGPADVDKRYNRFQFWPDKHNTGSRQISRLLAKEDMKALEFPGFSQASVALQGLSTLEKLLFAKDNGVTVFVRNGKATYHCHVVEAISHNLAMMSSALLNEWQQTPAPLDLLVPRTTLVSMKDYQVAGSIEVATTFFNDIHTQLQSIIDQKLLRPMGEDVSKARPQYLESWRSQRSMQNIVINLQALESLYDIGFAPVLKTTEEGVELDISIKQMFQYSQQTAEKIQSPLYQAIENQKQRAALDEFVKSLRILQQLLQGALAKALGVSQGFNALDGD